MPLKMSPAIIPVDNRRHAVEFSFDFYNEPTTSLSLPGINESFIGAQYSMDARAIRTPVQLSSFRALQFSVEFSQLPGPPVTLDGDFYITIGQQTIRIPQPNPSTPLQVPSAALVQAVIPIVANPSDKIIFTKAFNPAYGASCTGLLVASIFDFDVTPYYMAGYGYCHGRNTNA